MARARHKLLLIEDSIEDRELITAQLCKADDCEFDIETADNGKDALAKFEARAFDCVLLDYHLPDTDGIKLLAKFKQLSPMDSPVVLITGQGDERLAVKALREGAADYIVKSHASAEGLYRAVQNAIEKHRTAQRLSREREKFLNEQRERIESQERALAATEEMLRERKRLSDFFTQIPTPIVVLKGHKLVFEFINEPMRALLNIDTTNLDDGIKKLTDFFGREVIGIADLVYKSGRRFSASEFEIERAWTKDKTSLRYFNVNFEPLRGDDGDVTGVIFMMTDITQLVEARHLIELSEQKARDSEERFRKIAEIIPHMIWVVDTEGNGEYFNSAWTTYTLGKPSERLPQSWLEYVHEDDRGKILRGLKDEPSNGGVFTATFRLKRFATHEFRYQLAHGMPVRDETGKIIKWYISSSDVHEERALTQDLRNSEQRLQLATSASHVGIWEIDLETRRTWRNAEYDRSFGYEASPKSWSIEIFLDHVLTEDRLRIKSLIDASLESQKPFTDEFRVIWPNQTLHWLQISGGVEEAPDGRLRMAGTVIDITDRKFREQDLRDARSIAQAASETKTAFLANMSHEIRTPLNAIIGFTDLIARESTTISDRAKFAETVQRNGRTLMQIIDDILDLSKIEANKLSLNFERVDLVQLLEDIQFLFIPLANEKGVAFSIKIEDDMQNIIRTDAVRIRQVLMNAVSNALKFTSQGSVQLTVHRAQSQSSLPGWICFSIRDTGIGISEENQGKLFQSFTQADGSMTRKYGGTGLGLMLSRRLAKLLGGSFYLARSREGEGSTFELRIPEELVSQLPPQSPGEVPHPSYLVNVNEPVRIDGVHVLLVDDSPDSRMLAKRYLALRGASVEEADSASEALSRIEQSEFDIVVTDVQMPVMDGHALTRELRRRGFQQPIVGLSAHVFTEDRQRSLDAGMNDHIGKPVKQEELARTVQSWVAKFDVDSQSHGPVF